MKSDIVPESFARFDVIIHVTNTSPFDRGGGGGAKKENEETVSRSDARTMNKIEGGKATEPAGRLLIAVTGSNEDKFLP